MTATADLATYDSDLALRFAIQAGIDPAAIPDGHHVGWKAVHADLTSGHDRSFRWPAHGPVEAPDADMIVADGIDCGPGLHLARTAETARASGVPLHTILICAYRGDDVLVDSGSKVRLRRCVVLGIADAWSTNLTGANLTGAYLTGADLARANLTGAYLDGADLARANLARANLDRANLDRAYLARAYLTGANLARANLTGANLTRAYLTGADLARANLTGAYLDGANLSGAVADATTRWPDGFDPASAGVMVR
jgi:hypothetical protein